MRLWLDDIRPAPDGWVWCKSVNEAKKVYEESINNFHKYFKTMDNACEMFLISDISLDHDAGEYYPDGGDYIKFLDYLEEIGDGYDITIRIHSMNPVGIANMRRIIERNGWKEIR